MRYFLNVLFVLAFLPAMAQAAFPYAQYNPWTGDFVLTELRGFNSVSIHSASGKLRTSVLSEVPAISPASAQLPKLGSASVIDERFGIIWQIRNPPSPRVPFDFDSISFDKAVPAGTAISDLSMFVVTKDGDGYRSKIILVPEPATVTLGGLSLLALAALRRRK